MTFTPFLSVEDTIFALYCAIDDALKLTGISARDGKLTQRPGPPPELDDREVLCLSVLQEVLGFDSDNAYFNWLENSPLIRALFPKLIKRPKFAERRALLTDLADKLSDAFLQMSGESQPPFSSSTRILSMSAARCVPAIKNA
jgi:hypothetical protein